MTQAQREACLAQEEKKRINRKGDNTSAKKEGVGIKKIEKV
jgi:hypothetical protein